MLFRSTTEKVTLSSKEDLKESEVNINFNRIVNTDPDSITPGQFLFLEGEKEIEATDKILKGLSMARHREYIPKVEDRDSGPWPADRPKARYTRPWPCKPRF